MAESYSAVASGNIAPCRFVKYSTTAGQVTQCGAGEAAVGISQEQIRNAPYGSLDDGYAAIANERLRVYGEPEQDVMLELGGTVTRGAFLKSDADGKGVATTTDQDKYGAIAREAGVSGDLVRVQVKIGERSTA